MTHGTPTAWRHHGCRCPACHRALLAESRVAWAARQLRRGRDPASRVLADRLRRHIATLTAAGLTQAEVARRAAVAPSTITRILQPSTKRTSRIVANSLLAVAP